MIAAPANSRVIIPKLAGAVRSYPQLINALGESGAVGYAPNLDSNGTPRFWLSTAEQATRSNLKILNNDSGVLAFQSLKVALTADGGNNNIDCNNDGVATHGWEVEIANSLDDGRWTSSGFTTLYYVKTCFVGARIVDFDVGGGSGYWAKCQARWAAAAATRPNDTIAILLSLGINDLHAARTPAQYKTDMLAFIARCRAEMVTQGLTKGASAKIYCEKLMYQAGYSDWSNYNTKLDEIAASDGNMVTIGVSDCSLYNSDHRGYHGIRRSAARIVGAIFGGSTSDKIYSAAALRWGSPNPISAGVSDSGTALVYNSGGSDQGAVSVTSFPATSDWCVQLLAPDAATIRDIVFAIDDDNGSNFAWSSGNHWVAGVIRDGANWYCCVDGSGSSSTFYGVLTASYPAIIRFVRNANDIELSMSTDGGLTFIEPPTQNPQFGGVLAGKTTVWVRSLFQSAASGQQAEVQNLT